MPHSDKEAVLDALRGRYADFYGQYTELLYAGGEMRGPCPLHGGDGANFAVDAETGQWFCHSQCQIGGDVFDFISRRESVPFVEAVERAAAWAGLSAPAVSPRPGPVRRAAPPEEAQFLDPAIAKSAHDALMKSEPVQRYLLDSRGLTSETLRRFQIGVQHPAAKGGEWRVTFPVFDAGGRLTNVRRHLFQYKPDMDRAVLGKTLPWRKGLTADLFPLAAIEGSSEVLVVEGEADAALACQMGLPAVTGTLGAGNWKPLWTEALRGRDRVTLLYDGDAAGQDGCRKAALALCGAVADVRIASYPPGVKDLTDWVVTGRATADDLRRVIDEAVQFTKAQPGPQSGPALPATEPYQAFPLTDLGNGQRLARRHGADMRFCYDWGKWMVWDDQRWRRDDTGEVDRRAKDTARSVFQEAADCRDTAQQSELGKHALRSQAYSRLQAMISLAQSELPIPARVSDWDRHSWLLACDNGTLDLKTGELRDSRREDMGTKRAGAGYEAASEAPTWAAFLERILPDDDVRAFVQRAVGYTLTGDVSEQCLFFCYGSGSNGKSTLLRAVMDALGDYSLQAAPDLLIAKEGAAGGPNNDVAELQGTRFVATVEVEDGKRMAEGLVKQITGGDKVKARYMRQDYFEFEPTHKIWLAANHKPTIKGNDHAIWRRIKVIPFEETITGDEKDPHLAEKLRAELPGILRWAVQGCLDWQRVGLAEPDAVKAATKEYREEMDVLSDFLTECCVVRPALNVTAASLYTAYLKWCEETSERPLGKKNFGGRLREQKSIYPATGVGPKAAKGWQGVGLKDTNDYADFTDLSDAESHISNSKNTIREEIGEIRSERSVKSDHKASADSAISEEVLRIVTGSTSPILFTEIVKIALSNGHNESATKAAIKDLQNESRIEHNGSGFVPSRGDYQ